MAAVDPAPPDWTAGDHVERVKSDARQLAESLLRANDAGVSHALILPQLMLVFREVFGEMPAGFTLPAGFR